MPEFVCLGRPVGVDLATSQEEKGDPEGEYGGEKGGGGEKELESMVVAVIGCGFLGQRIALELALQGSSQSEPSCNRFPITSAFQVYCPGLRPRDGCPSN